MYKRTRRVALYVYMGKSVVLKTQNTSSAKGGKTMKLQITAKKMQVPQAFNEYAEKKLKKLDRFFGDEADALRIGKGGEGRLWA